MRKSYQKPKQFIMSYNWEHNTVLVAEDDALNFRYIELLLARRTSIRIIWAKDGKEALNICREDDSVDIVLLDLQLPEMDGITTLKAIKKINPYLPVIIQTANSWNNEEENCIQAGADGFFNKPLNIDELLEFMEGCIEIHPKEKHWKID